MDQQPKMCVGTRLSCEQGRSLRNRVPRSAHAVWEVKEGRIGPLELLNEQAQQRLAYLIPERYLRMSASPFAFFRGGALTMAADLAHTPTTGVLVQACGDAHLANFGGFASPERHLVFDINDFDETVVGPWEWDIKSWWRVLRSAVVTAVSNLHGVGVLCVVRWRVIARQ